MTNKWIKCSEQLPEDEACKFKMVLIYDRYRGVDIRSIKSLIYTNFHDITHWMELPSKPELEE